MTLPAIIAIVGPTGSGKTALALALAEQLGTEIISADSMQFYRGMEIGAATPTPAEQARVRHHFVSFLNPDEYMSASDYEQVARPVVAQLNEAGKVAVVCGGSGLYVSALIEGLFPGPGRDEEVRARLTEEATQHGPEHLFARLVQVDPAYAAALTSDKDLIRIVRALEVYTVTGRPYSEFHVEHQAALKPLSAVLVAPQWPREILYDRINRRVEAMVAAGWGAEVERLIANGYAGHIERLKALGFREMAAHLRGEQSLEQAIAQTQMHHRRYAKRQISWFTNVAKAHWIPAELPTDQWIARALEVSG